MYASKQTSWILIQRICTIQQTGAI